MLTFPTLAQQAVKLFETNECKSITTAAIRLGGEKTITWIQGRLIRWDFPDDTSIEVRGQGASHKYECFLP